MFEINLRQIYISLALIKIYREREKEKGLDYTVWLAIYVFEFIFTTFVSLTLKMCIDTVYRHKYFIKNINWA